jgi:purine nucleosidase
LPPQLIIDTDAGIDDAQAILLALGQPGVEVAAITTLSGNVHVDKVTKNVLKTLDAAGRRVPVYRGADRPLVNAVNYAEDVHGTDGLGDCNLPEPSGQIEPEHAVLALCRMAAAHPGRYTLVAIGPLTNVALATRLDPAFTHNLAGFVFMGGAYEAHGNTSIVAEFNVHNDPEAAAIVLDSFPQATMISWELTLNYLVPWDRLAALDSKRGPAVEFFNKISAFITANLRRDGYQGMAMPDALAVAVAIDPRIVAKSARAHVQVELGGVLTRGQTVVDWRGRPQVDVVKRIDLERFWQMMQQSLGVR